MVQPNQGHIESRKSVEAMIHNLMKRSWNFYIVLTFILLQILEVIQISLDSRFKNWTLHFGIGVISIVVLALYLRFWEHILEAKGRFKLGLVWGALAFCIFLSSFEELTLIFTIKRIVLSYILVQEEENALVIAIPFMAHLITVIYTSICQLIQTQVLEAQIWYCITPISILIIHTFKMRKERSLIIKENEKIKVKLNYALEINRQFLGALSTEIVLPMRSLQTSFQQINQLHKGNPIAIRHTEDSDFFSDSSAVNMTEVQSERRESEGETDDFESKLAFKNLVSTGDFYSNSILNYAQNMNDFYGNKSQDLILWESPINIRKFFHKISKLIGGVCALKGVSFTHLQNHELPEYLEIDERRFNQVIMNVLSTAIKTTKTGGIYLLVSWISKDKEQEIIKHYLKYSTFYEELDQEQIEEFPEGNVMMRPQTSDREKQNKGNTSYVKMIFQEDKNSELRPLISLNKINPKGNYSFGCLKIEIMD